MSLATRCPACTTTFKVVRDQLRISDGWVRCGRCSQVFDATQDLQDTASGERVTARALLAPTLAPAPSVEPCALPLVTLAPQAPTAEAPPVAEVAEARVQPQVPAAMPSAWPAADLLNLGATAPAPADPQPAWRQVLATSRPAAAWPGLVADEPWPMRRPSGSGEPAGEAARQPSPIDEAVDAQLKKALRRARVQSVRDARARRAEVEVQGVAPQRQPAAPEPSVQAVVHSPTVLRQASSADVPQPASAAMASSIDAAESSTALLDSVAGPLEPRARPARGLLLALLALLAMTVLVMQVMRHNRDAWAASQPALRPALNMLCQLSGCSVQAVRRIDAVRIDGSSFTPDRSGEHYQLQFSLRNAAAMPVAMPAVELSLLDANERVLMRRVFQPADFGAPEQMAPRSEQSAALTLAVRPPEGQMRPGVVGYSLLAFYP